MSVASSNVKILLVEDSATMQALVKASIGSYGDLMIANTIAEGDALINAHEFSLFVLDVKLPDGNGFQFCEKLKGSDSWKDIPVIFLTSEDQLDQRVRGFDLGAEDYVTKPFEPRELEARVAARLRRKATPTTSLVKGEFRIDLAGQSVFAVDANQSTQEFSLTPIEFKLLVHFVNNENKILSRDELCKAVWGKSVHVSNHTVDTHLSSLRKKLGGRARYIKAVVRKGYVFSIARQAEQESA